MKQTTESADKATKTFDSVDKYITYIVHHPKEYFNVILKMDLEEEFQRVLEKRKEESPELLAIHADHLFTLERDEEAKEEFGRAIDGKAHLAIILLLLCDREFPEGARVFSADVLLQRKESGKTRLEEIFAAEDDFADKNVPMIADGILRFHLLVLVPPFLQCVKKHPKYVSDVTALFLDESYILMDIKFLQNIGKEAKFLNIEEIEPYYVNSLLDNATPEEKKRCYDELQRLTTSSNPTVKNDAILLLGTRLMDDKRYQEGLSLFEKLPLDSNYEYGLRLLADAGFYPLYGYGLHYEQSKKIYEFLAPEDPEVYFELCQYLIPFDEKQRKKREEYIQIGFEKTGRPEFLALKMENLIADPDEKNCEELHKLIKKYLSLGGEENDFLHYVKAIVHLYGEPYRDIDKGLELLNLAVKEDNPDAKCLLAILSYTGRGVDYDPDKAMKLLLEAMEGGRIEAAILLFCFFRQKINSEKTMKKIHKSLEGGFYNGYIPSIFLYDFLNVLGFLVKSHDRKEEKDRENFYQMWKEESESKDYPSLLDFFEDCPTLKDFREKPIATMAVLDSLPLDLPIVKRLSEKVPFTKEGAKRLAQMIFDMDKEGKENTDYLPPLRLFPLLLEAALQEDCPPEIDTAIGICYDKGIVVDPNPEVAFQFAIRGEEGEADECKIFLADLYLSGYGPEEDVESKKAIELLEKVQNKDEEVLLFLAHAYSHSTEKEDLDKAEKIYKDLIAKGSDKAAIAYGEYLLAIGREKEGLVYLDDLGRRGFWKIYALVGGFFAQLYKCEGKEEYRDLAWKYLRRDEKHHPGKSDYTDFLLSTAKTEKEKKFASSLKKMKTKTSPSHD